ncbi:hypothetical protein N7465_003846 [Penicillium sp. CMV-2018d]|nr:hypothetical protein N7465_003846 [Penicillium sp. CMV-2018d]
MCRSVHQSDVASGVNLEPATAAGDHDLRYSSHDEGFRSLGYMYGSGTFQLGNQQATESPLGTCLDTLDVDDIQTTRQVLPPRPYMGKSERTVPDIQVPSKQADDADTDAMIQHFLSGPNYQYYVIYPPLFSRNYSDWWDARVRGRNPDRVMTCLLLRVCACSTQFPSDSLHSTLETELGENIQELSKRYHRTAQSLSITIGAGKGGLIQVQQLLLAAWWLKSDAQFIDSWHVLASSIHEAQELGLHDKRVQGSISEFETEMRRRMWCVLYVWDMHFSALLFRPRIIDSSSCSFELPALRLDPTDDGHDWPSPITHMVLLAQLFQILSRQFGWPNRKSSVDEILALQQVTSDWLAACPSIYKTTNTTSNQEPRYVDLQRWSLQVVAYMIMLQPLKQCLITPCGLESSNSHRRLQEAAVQCALHLMHASTRLARTVAPFAADFHTAIYTIFDTAATLCSGILHDTEASLVQRTQIIGAIGRAVSTMKWLSETSRTSAAAHSALSRLTQSLSLSDNEQIAFKFGLSVKPLTLGPQIVSGAQVPMSPDEYDYDATALSSLPGLLGGGHHVYDLSSEPLDEVELGSLAEIWSWESLNS